MVGQRHSAVLRRPRMGARRYSTPKLSLLPLSSRLLSRFILFEPDARPHPDGIKLAACCRGNARRLCIKELNLSLAPVYIRAGPDRSTLCGIRPDPGRSRISPRARRPSRRLFTANSRRRGPPIQLGARLSSGRVTPLSRRSHGAGRGGERRLGMPIGRGGRGPGRRAAVAPIAVAGVRVPLARVGRRRFRRAGSSTSGRSLRPGRLAPIGAAATGGRMAAGEMHRFADR